MGLFGKSDAEKEREEQAKHEEARRKMQESQRRREEKAKAAAAAKPGAAAAPGKGSAGAATPGVAAAKPGPSVPGMTPTAAQPSAAATQIYTVKKGDNLSKIAKQHLGDANAWRRIYEANRAVIGDDPDKIFPGQKLTLPVASPGTATSSAPNTPPAGGRPA
jgi:nucleoid-associated protein YgaU